MYVKTCESGRIKDFEQRSRVYNVVRYNAGFFPVDPDNRVIMELQCSTFSGNFHLICEFQSDHKKIFAVVYFKRFYQHKP